jgi:putative membrane protein insertion efficiency factor
MRGHEEGVLNKLEHGLIILATGAISIYRTVVSPVLPRSCRFVPTCSEYALEALKRHGILTGTLLAVRRVLRCHPLGGSGLDRVP